MRLCLSKNFLNIFFLHACMFSIIFTIACMHTLDTDLSNKIVTDWCLYVEDVENNCYQFLVT